MEKFFKIGEKIPRKDIWDRVINRWYVLMDNAITRCNIEELRNELKDLPYWYDEGTNVGFLAGAIWLEGGMVFQQLPVDRIYEGNKSKGRNDFLFEIGNFKCCVEAKIDNSGSSTNITENIIKKLNEAKEQLTNRENRYGINIDMAICFVIPHLRSLDNVDALNNAKDIFNKIEKNFVENNNIIATYIPQGNVKVDYEYYYERYYCPGVALVGELMTNNLTVLC